MKYVFLFYAMLLFFHPLEASRFFFKNFRKRRQEIKACEKRMRDTSLLIDGILENDNQKIRYALCGNPNMKATIEGHTLEELYNDKTLREKVLKNTNK